jgi:hypothetical protein
MNCYLCGAWDGVHVWLQWDGVAPEQGYRIRLAFRQPAVPPAEWGPWKPIEDARPYMRDWMVIAAWRSDWEVKAEVAIAGTDDWVAAQEVTFLRSRCRFKISTVRSAVRYSVGSEFNAIIDTAACHYTLNEDVELQPGEELEVELTASMSSGYCQLDYPAHFDISPSLGLRIQNVAPSEDDVLPTGRNFSKVAPVPRDFPVKIVVDSTRNSFRGIAGRVP